MIADSDTTGALLLGGMFLLRYSLSVTRGPMPFSTKKGCPSSSGAGECRQKKTRLRYAASRVSDAWGGRWRAELEA